MAKTMPDKTGAKTSWRAGIDLPLTIIAVAFVVAFLLCGVLFSDPMRIGGAHIYAWIAENFGWVYVMATAGFVFFILYLGFSKVGSIKLGDPDDKPEFPAFSWIAMMFALGVGIGLIFYGAAEPVILYDQPPPGGPEPRTNEAAIVGMQYSLFHWALHPWAFFGVAGLALGYATHNKGRPNLVTSTLKPMLGKRTDTLTGRGINTWVVVTTLVGNSVTLGLGTLQIMAGLKYVGGIDTSTWLLLLVLGPVSFILDLNSEALGGYIFNFLPMAFETGPFDEGVWMQNWTVFFWAWGISWAPDVGSFLAKISRGRTIRQYVLGVLVAPSVGTIVWFAVLGGAALDLQFNGVDIAAAASDSPQKALFEVLGEYPLTIVTSIAVIVLAAVFFVSGADAGAIVLGTFSSWGDDEPKTWIVLMWGALIGAVSVVLLIVGGLGALQWGAIVVASPFVLVLVAMCVGLTMDLRKDGAFARRHARGDRARVDSAAPTASDD